MKLLWHQIFKQWYWKPINIVRHDVISPRRHIHLFHPVSDWCWLSSHSPPVPLTASSVLCKRWWEEDWRWYNKIYSSLSDIEFVVYKTSSMYLWSVDINIYVFCNVIGFKYLNRHAVLSRRQLSPYYFSSQHYYQCYANTAATAITWITWTLFSVY